MNQALGIDFFAIDAAFGFRFGDLMYMRPFAKSFNVWNAVTAADGFSLNGIGPSQWITSTDGYVLTIEPIGSGSPVPEPSTMAIAAPAVCGLRGRRRFIDRRSSSVV